MANEGKRTYCKCIKSMPIIIGKQEEILFHRGKTYFCTIRESDTQANYYKIYGEEFSLSCNESEFNEYFRIIHNHKE